MNYRQWKKNYKKKHGYNPPFEEDKRQQAKAAKRAFRKIADNYRATAAVYNGKEKER
nr:MAG TPA: hypothetical protein [Caudoviricetes sp.]